MLESVTNNPLAFAGIAGVLAAVGVFWGQARGFIRYLSSIAVLQSKITSNGMDELVGAHIRREYKKVPSGLKFYSAYLTNINGQPLNSFVPFELPQGTSIWYGKRGVFVVSVGSDGMSLTSIRWISSPRLLIQDGLEAYEAERSRTEKIGTGNFYVTRVMGTAGDPNAMAADFHSGRSGRNVGGEKDAPAATIEAGPSGSWNKPIIGVDESWMYSKDQYIRNKMNVDPLKGLFFDQEVHDLLGKIKQWYVRRDWYTDHGIPWRMGVMLEGPGGTGKSSLARVAAQTLGIPLYQYYMNTLTDREFVREWDGMNTPCVVALEDFDTVFHGREPVTVHKSLSFECVLNQISGISSLNGILLVVTTNKLEHIDAALGQLDEKGRPTRPGRIDKILHMGATSLKQRHDIAKYVLDGWADDLVDEMVARGEGTTAAQFQSECVQAAVDRLSEKESV